ncbi:hypothetical protein CDD82_4300 [Ophiocordyceps australis]|uniref:Uncharacterized protein n=1 Tax=Ophiocordyceps australis TaxID=1399860 RepID=A0A2C5Z8M8_9HYPO|nr:hypothetical protein CDD82_4300 [Ophiocordyceps australis]
MRHRREVEFNGMMSDGEADLTVVNGGIDFSRSDGIEELRSRHYEIPKGIDRPAAMELLIGGLLRPTAEFQVLQTGRCKRLYTT